MEVPDVNVPEKPQEKTKTNKKKRSVRFSNRENTSSNQDYDEEAPEEYKQLPLPEQMENTMIM